MHEERRRLEDAPPLEDLAKLAQEKPDDIEAQRQYGWALYAETRFQEAVEVLKAAAEKDPHNPETQYALGLASKQAGENELAKKAFRATLDNIGKLESKTRATMMGRLAQGNLNYLTEGRWKIPERV